MFLSLIGLASCARHAILYSGTMDYYNYRFEADVFTIYQQLLNRGFKKEEITLYAYDDIAKNPENPYTNHIFHTKKHKVNVYPGNEAIDYRADDVTAQSFFDGITSLPTTNEDYVFIFYGGSGGHGVLGTPKGDLITADALSQALTTASESNLFKKCLFLIQASFAGSIAETFTAPNLATITAANDDESSYADVYDTVIKVYLTNELSNHFISILDTQPSITVGELFTQLKTLTLESHACYYGDESIQSLPISTFFGIPNSTLHQSVKTASKAVNPHKATEKSLQALSQDSKVSISARSRLHLIQRKALTEKLDAVLEMLVKYVDENNYDNIINDKASKVTPNYYQVVQIFIKKFGKINPEDYDRFKILKNLSASYSKAKIIQGIFAILP